MPKGNSLLPIREIIRALRRPLRTPAEEMIELFRQA
jgi:hypothetical protein